ncbi:unnamed protein product [Didymodactylos carnosus]|uniref:Uncharacterized protein n=1 Tax=Didymodactylos carnosus TaxID=1234261 RepID=A0A815HPX7_9BILA|nr:unnamed protein product [Didymodactylos carnosus]CAF4228830.1 unnamed protein product [Didymodactylos carnosus]
MSVDINEQNQVLIGISLLDTVVVLSANTTSLTIVGNLNRYHSNTGFGKSVAWIDNTTVAILVYSLAEYPGSSSTVHVWDIESSFTTPIFAFPNNQQSFASTSYVSVSPSFLMISSWSSNMIVLASDGEILIILSSPPGYYSGSNISLLGIVNVFSPVRCSAGTFKNSSGVAPCFVCPPGSKNLGDSAIECAWCQTASFCPLGSVNDVNYSTIETISDSRAYPNSPESTIFDDILIQNMFTIGSTSHCIVVSPLFWTSVIILFAILVLVVMAILKLFPDKKNHRIFIKKIFKQLDLVGEGELWIGGVISLGIIVLVSFAYWFSSSYLQQYPIETSGDSIFACDTSLRNAKFSTGLQLLSLPKSDEQQPIFNMLDQQEFTMSVDFVNTLYRYTDTTVQQNIGSNIVLLNISNYRIQDNATLHASVVLPFHQMNVQFNLTGPYSVGGVRICLSGPSASNDSYTVQQLNFCQFFYTANQTLAHSSSIDLQLTKVINETDGLSASDKTLYSGLWVPTFTVNTISDQLLYSQQGEYLRYFSTRTTLLITVGETQFYIQNTQSPIAKQTEIVFHNLLFTIVCLEIFGLIFLVIKLLFVPLFMRLFLEIQRKYNRILILDTDKAKTEKEGTLEANKITSKPSGQSI